MLLQAEAEDDSGRASTHTAYLARCTASCTQDASPQWGSTFTADAMPAHTRAVDDTCAVNPDCEDKRKRGYITRGELMQARKRLAELSRCISMERMQSAASDASDAAAAPTDGTSAS